MTDYLKTFAAVASVGLWSVLMIAAGIYSQKLHQRRQEERAKAERIAAIIAQAKQRRTASPRYPTPDADTIRNAQA